MDNWESLKEYLRIKPINSIVFKKGNDVSYISKSGRQVILSTKVINKYIKTLIDGEYVEKRGDEYILKKKVHPSFNASDVKEHIKRKVESKKEQDEN